MASMSLIERPVTATEVSSATVAEAGALAVTGSLTGT